MNPSYPNPDPLAPWAPLLDAPESASRREARENPDTRRAARPTVVPPADGWVNLHAHTTYSFNAYGFTPTGFAWRARRAGLAAAGIVDFDVLDGADEFLEAGRAFGLKAMVGLETRVFVPEFSSRVLNSPGEPGIAYHMGVGFCRSAVPPTQQPFLSRLRETSERRNRDLVRRVNTVLGPAALDYDADVRPLTPAGNATERHICLAYARKAAARFPDGADLSAFWRNALGLEGEVPDLPEGPALLNRIRARTMKRGGIGYVKPEEGAFPNLAETNRFILACGALPVLTWLDGSSEGEGALDELLEVMISHGAEAANIIPDRNFTPGQKDEKLEQLYRFADRARLRGLPLIAGTEMNAPGNRFVDDFSAPELSPLKDDFLRGSYWLFAHTVLEDRGGLGFGSDWARSTFPDRPARIAFYEELGQKLPPDAAIRLPILDAKERPDSILDRADC